MRQEINSIEGKIRILEIARSESWELISQRLNALLERSVGTLSERLPDLEQTVQSQRTTPERLPRLNKRSHMKCSD